MALFQILRELKELTGSVVTIIPKTETVIRLVPIIQYETPHLVNDSLHGYMPCSC